MEKVLRISVKADVKAVQKSFKNLKKKDLPFAISKAINDTMFQVKRKVNKDMDSSFRGGAVPFTKQGLMFKRSNKENLTGIMYLKPEQYKYLKYQMDGGVRSAERGFIPIPFRNRVSTTKYGNLRKDQIDRLLSSKQNKLLTINGVRGIYKIYKDKSRRPHLLVALNQKRVTYTKKKFKYYGLVGSAANQYFRKNMEKAIAYAIKTSR